MAKKTGIMKYDEFNNYKKQLTPKSQRPRPANSKETAGRSSGKGGKGK